MNIRKASILLLALAVLAIFLVAPAGAQSKTFYWERFDVDVQVLESGDLIVTENQTLNFSGAPFTFGYRTIPTGSAGNNDGIEDVEVFEGDVRYEQSYSQQPNTYRATRQGDEIEIYWYFTPALPGHPPGR